MVCVKPPEAFPVYHRVPQLFNQHSIEGLRKSIKNVIAFVNIVFHKHNESYDASPLLYKYACKYWYLYQIYTRTQTLHIYVILLDLLHVTWCPIYLWLLYRQSLNLFSSFIHQSICPIIKLKQFCTFYENQNIIYQKRNIIIQLVLLVIQCSGSIKF